MTTCRNNNNIHNIGRVGMDGGMKERERERERRNGVCVGTAMSSLYRFSWPFWVKYSPHTNGMPQHCVSISVCLYLSLHLPPPLPHLLRLRLCRLLISNSAWSAGCRQTGVEREDAVFVCRCLPLLPSK